MNKKNIFITALMGAALVACSELPKEAYYNRGQPESLIDASSEMVTLKINSPASIEEITDWLNKEQPTRAELKCSESDSLCSEARNLFHQFGVPVIYASLHDNSVALIYERVQARDCENRYIDNMINPYNLNHPTFGCTVAVNMLQMVSDKRQFTNPALMDAPSAIMASQNYIFASQPVVYSPPRASSEFSTIATQQTLQTSGLTGGSAR